MDLLEIKDAIEEINHSHISESRGFYEFERMGRPKFIYDQRSNQNNNILLSWQSNMKMWEENQITSNFTWQLIIIVYNSGMEIY